MDDQKESSGEKLIGLLEIRLRNSSIEFEYLPGTRVSELITLLKRKSTIGEPVIWRIMCQDENGNYIALRNNDEIPLKAPSSNQQQKPALSQQHTLSNTTKYSVRLTAEPITLSR